MEERGQPGSFFWVRGVGGNTCMNKILRNQILKRAIDIVGAVFGLTLFSALLIPACVLDIM